MKTLVQTLCARLGMASQPQAVAEFDHLDVELIRVLADEDHLK